jgi:hypothetical protein
MQDIFIGADRGQEQSALNCEKDEGPLHQPWPLVYLARPERFELPTAWFEARNSVQLSYGRKLGKEKRARQRCLALCLWVVSRVGIEPTTT